MTIHVYKSSDPGAPNSLNGTIGSLIPILDACLVNGYGSGPDTKAPAGFDKVFSGTNKAVYRAQQGQSRMFYRVDDSNPYGGSYNHVAWIRGYESMSDVDVGNGPWPLVSTHSIGSNIIKHSSNNNSTAREWMVFTDGLFVHILISVNGHADVAGHKGGTLSSFGEAVSFKVGDPWCSLILCGDGSGAASVGDNWWWSPCLSQTIASGGPAATDPGICARDHAGIATPVKVHGYPRAWETGAPGNANHIPYPDPVTGGMLWEDQTPFTCAGVLRGLIPGVGYPLQTTPLPPGSVFTSNGRDWYVFNPVRDVSSTTGYQMFIDITGPWR